MSNQRISALAVPPVDPDEVVQSMDEGDCLSIAMCGSSLKMCLHLLCDECLYGFNNKGVLNATARKYWVQE